MTISDQLVEQLVTATYTTDGIRAFTQPRGYFRQPAPQ